MSLVFDVNTTHATADNYVFTIKTVLVSAGWIVLGSSDGTSFENTGQTAGPFDVWSVVGDASNTDSYCRIGAPDSSGTEWSFHRDGSAATNWEFSYSLTGFTAGDATATVPPTGTNDEALWLTTNWGENSSVVGTIVAEDTAVNGVFPFYAMSTSPGVATQNGMLLHDVGLPSPGGHDNPVIVAAMGSGFQDSNMLSTTALSSTNGAVRTWDGAALSPATKINLGMRIQYTVSALGVPGAIGTAPDGGDLAVQPIWMHAGICMGSSYLMRLAGVGSRDYPNAIDEGTDRWVGAVDGLLLRYPQSETPAT